MYVFNYSFTVNKKRSNPLWNLPRIDLRTNKQTFPRFFIYDYVFADRSQFFSLDDGTTNEYGGETYLHSATEKKMHTNRGKCGEVIIFQHNPLFFQHSKGLNERQVETILARLKP